MQQFGVLPSPWMNCENVRDATVRDRIQLTSPFAVTLGIDRLLWVLRKFAVDECKRYAWRTPKAEALMYLNERRFRGGLKMYIPAMCQPKRAAKRLEHAVELTVRKAATVSSSHLLR